MALSRSRCEKLLLYLIISAHITSRGLAPSRDAASYWRSRSARSAPSTLGVRLKRSRLNVQPSLKRERDVINELCSTGCVPRYRSKTLILSSCLGGITQQ